MEVPCSLSESSPGIAYYEDAGDEAGTIKVHAALPVAGQSGREHGFDVVELEEVPAAAALVHCGSIDHVLPSIQALAQWIDASGYQSLGYARELTLTYGDIPDDWVTELAEPITLK